MPAYVAEITRYRLCRRY